MQRSQLAEICIALKGVAQVQRRKCQLKGNDHPDQKADNAPEHRGDHTGAHDAIHIFIQIGPHYGLVNLTQHPDEQRCCHNHYRQRIDHIGRIMRQIRSIAAAKATTPSRISLT